MVARPIIVSGSTAKLWFWLVISTRPVPRCCTGWLPPWWPNGIFTRVGADGPAQQLVAEADPEDGNLDRADP